jgi:hypothetical protein
MSLTVEYRSLMWVMFAVVVRIFSGRSSLLLNLGLKAKRGGILLPFDAASWYRLF